MKEPIIINRGKITFVVHENKVIVGVGFGQWTSYNQYDNWNRQGITEFRKNILKSKDSELTTPAEVMSLAYSCGIKGSGTQKPKEVE